MKDVFIAHPKNAAEENALKAFLKALKIKFEVAELGKSPYSQEFVEKIQSSRKQAKEGKTVKMDLDDIWKE